MEHINPDFFIYLYIIFFEGLTICVYLKYLSFFNLEELNWFRLNLPNHTHHKNIIITS